MLLIDTYVSQSEIQGLGVFAGQAIAKGSLIWELHPQFDIFIDAAMIPHLPAHMRTFFERYTYPHLEMPGMVVLDADNGRYINHSLTPNTDFRIFDKGYALVDIGVGEEITCNYFEFDPTFTGFFPDLVAAVELNGFGRHTNGR